MIKLLLATVGWGLILYCAYQIYLITFTQSNPFQ